MNRIAKLALPVLCFACGTSIAKEPDASLQSDAARDVAPAADVTADASDGAAGPTADEILAKLGACNEITSGRYKMDNSTSSPADIPVCGLVNAVWFTADMDVDCDGKQTAECNPMTDPWFQNQTAATDSMGQPLDAARLPFVVVPGASTRWDYKTGPLQMGSVALVLHAGKMEFGILGDVGPAASIGEASYAMVKSLGADPDPKIGGVGGKKVTYVLFTGKSGVVSKKEDHAEAISVGKARLAQLMIEN